jgi:hypothetical protein
MRKIVSVILMRSLLLLRPLHVCAFQTRVRPSSNTRLFTSLSAELPTIEYPSGAFTSFEDACYAAAETGRTLFLRQDATLHSIVRLKSSLHVVYQPTICDGGEDNPQSPYATISGSLHSLFMVENKNCLWMENICLMHTLEADDHRQVGAAVLLRYKAQAVLKNCRIVSHSGYCCWLVQKSKASLTNCILEARTRSAIVCFGKPTCHLVQCVLPDAGVHAVCARGASHVDLKMCQITNSAVRAIYAYANASLTLEECTVTGTLRTDQAAIEVSALQVSKPQKEEPTLSNSKKGSTKGPLSPPEAASLTIRRCVIKDNLGAGVRIRGHVTHVLEENEITGNGGSNVEFLADLVDEMSNEQSHFRRDSAGSSFRMGDWWCPACEPQVAVMGRLDKCPRCSADKANVGRMLTSHEILRCNRQDTKTATMAGTAAAAAASSPTEGVTWLFDRDNDKGWVAYDEESCNILEDTFQKFSNLDESMNRKEAADPLVFLQGGKYQVNVRSMEQINVQTQFPRLVQRRSGC